MSIPIQGFRVSTTFRVEFADTDAQGVVYYPNYLRFFDRGRCAYWKAIGLSDEEVRKIEQDTVVVEIDCQYRASASFYDRLTVYTKITMIKRSSFRLQYSIYNEESSTCIAEGKAVMVNTDRSTGKSAPLPVKIKDRIRAMEGEDLEVGA